MTTHLPGIFTFWQLPKPISHETPNPDLVFSDTELMRELAWAPNLEINNIDFKSFLITHYIDV